MSGFKKGLKDGIPIALGYLSVSFTFGLQGVKGGLSWWETVLISICNVTSAGQFAGLNIILCFKVALRVSVFVFLGVYCILFRIVCCCGLWLLLSGFGCCVRLLW